MPDNGLEILRIWNTKRFCIDDETDSRFQSINIELGGKNVASSNLLRMIILIIT